jgi:hypothetical protein
VAVNVTTGQQREVFSVKSPELLHGSLDLNADGDTLTDVIDPSFAFYWGKGSNSESARLIRIGVGGNDYRELFRSARHIPNSSWTSDGAAVVAYVKGSGFMRIPANGGNPEIMESPATPARGLSPDGSHTIIEAAIEGAREILALDNVSALLRSAR